MNTIEIYKRKTLYKKINNTDDLLEYLNSSNKTKFIKINKSLITYLNKQNSTIAKTNFDIIIQKYQSACSNRTKLFWTRRGYSEEESINKISELQNNSKHINYKKRLIPNQKNYWILKGYSEEEAAQKVTEIQKVRSPRCKEYYTNKGYTNKEAINEVHKHQNNSDLIDYDKRLLPSNIEYWTNQGFTKTESAIKVSNHQTTFSKELCVRKYGTDADKVLKEVAKKKRNTFHLRPQSEQNAINIKRGSGSIGWWTPNGFEFNKDRKYSENTQGILYYFECEIEDIKYWKIGISSKTFNQRFNKTFQKRYKVKNIKIEKYNMFECFNKEQNILYKNKEYRVRTILGTEYFCKDVLDL
jgi:hypothetical protein